MGDLLQSFFKIKNDFIELDMRNMVPQLKRIKI